MVPGVLLVVNTTAVVALPLQTTWLVGWFTWDDGLTVIVKVFVGPVQETVPLVYVGVTIIVASTGAVPILIAVNAVISPVPVAANPIVGSEFAQL